MLVFVQFSGFVVFLSISFVGFGLLSRGVLIEYGCFMPLLVFLDGVS